MKKMALFVGIGLVLLVLSSCEMREAAPEPSTFGIVLHGGAGTMRKENLTAEMEAAYREKLAEALQVGYGILKNGGSSLDAVEQTIHILEDSPLFNAGKGAVYTHEGTHELDASIMDGRTRNAGAVAGVQRVRHPISLARQVLENSPHVMLSGAGAEAFAAQQGLELVDPAYFHTERRYRQLQKALEKAAAESVPSSVLQPEADHKFGTVGVAALDRQGNLAAGTSTGGMTNKRFGRIGDSPVIGAGTYADNRTCAVSATGHGEYFIRAVVAYDISALMAYRGMTLQQAADKVVMKKLVELGGEGGIIAIDKHGNIAMPFNTPGMYRGYIDRNGQAVVKIFRE